MNEIVDFFDRIKIIPVITMETSEDAEPLADALIEGGLPCAEVTFRTDAAPDTIKRLAACKNLLVGAGSVLNTKQAELAMDAGAGFIVSPGFNPAVVQYCIKNNFPVFPGVLTPSEMTLALEYGLSVLKFFPAQVLGGLNALKAICAPFPMIKFIPTGGINPQNLLLYLQFRQVIACGGSWMVKKELILEKKFQEIQRLVSEAVSMIKGVPDS
jgi:2-dehydro-3-deoxyphosphogluconate aldolase/(4S)-4-hydroxy-2-oxoglutarate aldolase